MAALHTQPHKEGKESAALFKKKKESAALEADVSERRNGREG